MPGPFLHVLLCWWLGLDGVRRALDLLAWSILGDVVGNPYEINLPVEVLWVLVDQLLLVMLVLRTRAGRHWTRAILAVHILYLLHILAVRHPEMWLYLSPLGRAKVAFSCGLDLLAIVYLSSRPAREHLTR